ncbi:hypothetical protein SNE40_000833 [Patella caerulea]|uniref:Pre-rRNA-processing protein RIX1 N-terminal domain-containing protein n=1 Tax=Patella caerulea TaxID=87958 RepID=A0AAN8QHE4_PATCE
MAASSENVLSALLPLYFGDDSSLPHVPHVISNVDDHQLFAIPKTNSLHPVISHIHTCLNSSNKRLEGLLLLEKLVVQSSTLIFTDYVNTWIKLLLQILKGQGETVFHQQSCKIISLILKISTDFSEISRDVATNIIPQLLPVLLNAQDFYKEEAIHCIRVCCETFPGPTGSFRNKIEKLLLADLQNPIPKSDSAHCLTLLGGCGPGGKNRVKHSLGWRIQFDKIYNTLKHTQSQLYEMLETEESSSSDVINGEMFQLNIIPDNTVDRRDVLIHRFTTFSQVLTSLFTESFTAVAEIPVENILRLVCDCLAVNGKMLEARPSTDHLLLLALLPTVHKTALSILNSLILMCRQVLIPFTSTINKLFIQSLVWTRVNTKYGQQKQYCTLRECVYKTMTTWLQVLGSSTNLVAEETDLIKEIISDVTPQVDVIKLSTTGMNTGLEPPKKKKKKNAGYQDITQGMSSYRKTNILANSTLTSNCLKVFQLFISSFGSSLQIKSYKDIQEVIVSILLDVQCNREVPPVPYSDDKSRKRLYAVLKACVISPHSKLPSLLQCAVRFFTIGQNDSSVMVSSFCREALSICECLFHPRAPCLRGPNFEVSTIHSDKSIQKETMVNNSSVQNTPNKPLVPSKTLTLSRSKVEKTSVEPTLNQPQQPFIQDSNIEADSDSDLDEEPEDIASSKPKKLSFEDMQTLENVADSHIQSVEESEMLTSPEKMSQVEDVHGSVVSEDMPEEKPDLMSLDVQTQSKDVESMTMSFVDAGPDSD